jgi:hypothetical protein
VKLRCDLHVNGGERKLQLMQGPNEPEEHLALKLGAYLQFWDFEPVIDAGVKTPALAQYEFMPDVAAFYPDGSIKLWVECGSSTMNKLLKLTRRLPRGRVVVVKTTAREAQRLRLEVQEKLDKPHRIEILCWPGSSFKDWAATVGENVEVYGEASELSINAVVNEKMFAIDLERY